MRREPTHSEWLLWLALRAGQLGVTFRRQVVLQGYIVDFYASQAKLIVEIDGAWHTQRPLADARREILLTNAGYRILHVTPTEVEANLPTVLTRVRHALER